MKLQLNNVHKSFGGATKVLNGISLDVAEGEMVCLIGGASGGSGKSTLCGASTCLIRLMMGGRSGWMAKKSQTLRWIHNQSANASGLFSSHSISFLT